MLRSLAKQLWGVLFSRQPTVSDVAGGFTSACEVAHGIVHHRGGRYNEAEVIYQGILRQRPNDPEVLQLLGNLRILQGRPADAAPFMERAAALQLDAESIYWNWAVALHAKRMFAEAVPILRRVLALRPSFVEALARLNDALVAINQLGEAEECCRRIITLTSGAVRAKACSDLGTLLLKQGRQDEAIASYEAALALDRGAHRLHSNLLYAMHYHPAYSAERIFGEHRRWAEIHADRFDGSLTPITVNASVGRVLRIGYVSPDFRHHPVSDFVEPVFRHHDCGKFDIHCYSDVLQQDQYTRRLQSLRLKWRDTGTLSDDALAQLIREDRIDILVDLAGHTKGNRLLVFARRPAPVQVTWIGYPDTTGLKTVDYRVTDPYCDPPGTTDHLYSEKLVRLPAICVVFQPPVEAPGVNPLPAAARGYVTFGSFNTLRKVTPEVIALWVRILLKVPTARLMIASIPEGRTQTGLRQAFAERGVDVGRLDLRARMPYPEFLKLHHEVDIALDPFPYNGSSTTFLSLWMGVPVITLAGASHVSRLGVTILNNAGLTHLVAESAESYVATAVALAENPDELANLRATLRDRMKDSPTMDGVGLTRALEDAYTKVWAEFCHRKVPR